MPRALTMTDAGPPAPSVVEWAQVFSAYGTDHCRAGPVAELRAGSDVHLSRSRSRRCGCIPVFDPKLLECQDITVDCLPFLIGEQQILPQPDQVAFSFED